MRHEIDNVIAQPEHWQEDLEQPVRRQLVAGDHEFRLEFRTCCTQSSDDLVSDRRQCFADECSSAKAIELGVPKNVTPKIHGLP